MTINFQDIATSIANTLLAPLRLPTEAPPVAPTDEQGSAPLFDDAARLEDRSEEVLFAGNYAAADTEASGRDAAASLIHMGNNSLGSDKSAQAHAFNQQIEAHKDDPEWLAEYFGALGEDRVGELMRLSITETAIGSSGSPDDLARYQNTVDNLRTALDTLEKSGNLTQEDMTALYKSLDLDTSDGNVFGATLVSDLFANSSQAVKELFFNAAMAEGNDASAAIASHVLASMPVEDQVRILDAMSQEELDSFVEMAMRGQFEAPDMEKWYGEGDTQSRVTIGGISDILANANNETYYHPEVAVPDYPPHLQTALFDATASALTNQDIFDKFTDDVQFKEELAQLTLKEHDGFLDRALDADGGTNGEDLGSDTRAEYSKVLEMTLFTPPLPDSAEDLVRHIDDRFNEIGEDLANMDDAAFEEKYGRNRGAMAGAFGQMTGVFFEALDSGLTRVENDADKAAEIMDPLFKLVDFGIGQGLGKAGPIGAVLTKALNLSGASAAVKSEVKELIREGHISEAIQLMKDNGVDLSELGEGLYEHMHDDVLPNRTAPNGTYQGEHGDVSIKDAWQNGYDFVEGAPRTN